MCCYQATDNAVSLFIHIHTEGENSQTYSFKALGVVREVISRICCRCVSQEDALISCVSICSRSEEQKDRPELGQERLWLLLGSLS